jgi:hypothetical protein
MTTDSLIKKAEHPIYTLGTQAINECFPGGRDEFNLDFGNLQALVFKVIEIYESQHKAEQPGDVVERVAKAICLSRNPHGHWDTEWEQSLRDASAAIAAMPLRGASLSDAKGQVETPPYDISPEEYAKMKRPGEAPTIERGTIEHLVKRQIPHLLLGLAELDREDIDEVIVSDEFVTEIENALERARDRLLLGHRDLEVTTVYLHLSQRHLSATASPLDALTLSSQGGHKHI